MSASTHPFHDHPIAVLARERIVVLDGAMGTEIQTLGLSDEAFEMSDGWIVASLLLWAGLVAVSWFLIRPSLADTSERARSTNCRPPR